MRFLGLCFSAALAAALLTSGRPASAENLLRNGSFELPFKVGTTPMLQGQEPMQYHWGDGKTMFISWQPTGAEAWWTVGVHPGDAHIRWPADKEQAHSGGLRAGAQMRRCLWLHATDKPVGIVTGAGQRLPAGKVTFSLWVRTEKAAGRVRFDCLPDNPNMSAGFLQETAAARCELPLPADSGWTRLSGTIVVPAGDPPQTLAIRVQLDSGTAWLDDAQVEPGEKATPFNVRPAEQVRVSIEDPRALPVFTEGKTTTVKAVTLNAGTQPLSGVLTVSVARWNGEGKKVVLQQRLSGWAPGAVLKVKAPLAGLPPDAYVAFARLEQGGKVLLDGLQCFDGTVRFAGAAPANAAGGRISRAMVQAPCVARFAVADARPNRELFGSGDMMLNTGGSWWGGYPIADYIAGRRLGFRFSRENVDDDATYRLAAGGMRALGNGPRPWTAPEDLPDSLRNPLKHECADLSNPDAWPYLERMWRKLALDLKGNPIFPLLNVTGEEMVLYGGALCPTDAADADFRNWVKERYGTLASVSAAWNRPVPSWESIEQPISARMVRDQIVKLEKEQGRRPDWLGAADTLNADQGKYLKADPGRGMDWLRWRSALYVRSVERLAKVFHAANPNTLLSNHFCWPDFVPQTTYGLARVLDALGIDTQYPCGLPGSLGTPAEMTDMLGIYESFADEKPVWGHEIYIQPRFPAEMPATQIWGLVAHGMKVVNNFAWKPYSDAGLQAKRWNEEGAPPWWFVIDFDGKHMPQFDALARATREVNRFGDRFDGAALKRVKPDAALFVSDDAGVLAHYETLGKWWESPITQARCELGWLLRLNGISLDYLDDTLLAQRLKEYRTVFVPYSPNISDASLRLLADFAKEGGRAVFVGPPGWQDPWLLQRPEVGGEALKSFDWEVYDFKPDPVADLKGAGPLDIGQPLTGFAGACETMFRPSGKPVLTDAAGKAIGWELWFGKGRVVALSAFPRAYTQSPHADPTSVAFAGKLAQLAGAAPRAWWHSNAEPTPGKPAGEGAPVVDVKLRQSPDGELFLFVMNLGGEGAGEVTVKLGSSQWKLTDALAGTPVAGSVQAGVWRLPMTLKPWGYRVVRMVRGK